MDCDAAVDGPIVRCRTASAYIGDKNVRLTCEVRARPGLTALFWVIDVNGTAVTEGVVIDEYWSLNMVSIFYWNTVIAKCRFELIERISTLCMRFFVNLCSYEEDV